MMREPVRVLHVFGRLDRGGAETMVMNLYRDIDRKKIQFDFVICTTDECDYSSEIKALGGRIFHIPRFNSRNSIKYSKVWHEFFKHHKEYGIIHGHLRSTASIYLNIAKQYGLITIAHSHSTSSGTGLPALVKNLLQYRIRYIADYLFACSNPAGEWLYGKKACQKDNYCLLNNAIDAKDFVYNEEKRAQKRKELQLEDKFVIGHVGAFKREKNHEFIIKVFKAVYKKCDRAVLLLIGDGELRPKIEKEVSEAGLMSSVIFTGVSSEISSLMQAADVFFFPSLYEGLPVTVVEAQAAGLPCVISDTVSKESSVTDLVEYFSLGNTVEEWADKLLSHTEGCMRKNTFNEIKKANYDIKTTSAWLQDFYLRLSENS